MPAEIQGEDDFKFASQDGVLIVLLDTKWKKKMELSSQNNQIISTEAYEVCAPWSRLTAWKLLIVSVLFKIQKDIAAKILLS